jgi:tRNA pseudouridine55 synthase
VMDGFLIIDKGRNMTSYDVVKRLKRIQSFNKIGYIGTLDKNATGILPVAINGGVKVIPFLENGEKTYQARFILGVTTDTLDMDGTKITEVEAPVFDSEMVKETLYRFKGKIVQKIPIYSSKKIDGKPLYKLARKGIPVDTPTKEVEVYDIVFLNYAHPYVDVEVRCSKGTYIRVIAHDFGSALGCGAALHTLKRTQHGEFGMDKSVSIDCFTEKEDIVKYLVALEDVLHAVKGVTIDPVLEKFLKNGMPIPLFGGTKGWKQDELAKLMSKDGGLLAIGRVDTDSKTIKTKRLIHS